MLPETGGAISCIGHMRATCLSVCALRMILPFVISRDA
jgi:hypothetical protein